MGIINQKPVVNKWLYSIQSDLNWNDDNSIKEFPIALFGGSKI